MEITDNEETSLETNQLLNKRSFLISEVHKENSSEFKSSGDTEDFTRSCQNLNVSNFWHPHVYHKKSKLTSHTIADILGETLLHVKKETCKIFTPVRQEERKSDFVNMTKMKDEKSSHILLPPVLHSVNEALNLTTDKQEEKSVLPQKGKN